MNVQKCCAHCPGKSVSPGNQEFHECCQPTYVSGNLRISSLKKHVAECPKQRETREDRSKLSSKDRPTCHEQFALAKKLHAENLEHQPLPDRVHDSIFKHVRVECCDCCKQEAKDRSKSLNERYGSILGCKKPRTKMDLAISWETPVDPIYEPPRPTHVDGSEGGIAPAIFNLVQRSSTSGATTRSAIGKNDKASSFRRDQNKSEGHSYYSRYENRKEDKEKGQCCCDCLCKGLNGVSISKRNAEKCRKGSFRNCIACQTKGSKDDPRLIRSAVGLALGLEKGDDNKRKRGNEITIPKPRTPFAKRSFCIDTLTPPFSVVNRYRDADYPEHWRLMSVYQQSYRNPYKRRNCRC